MRSQEDAQHPNWVKHSKHVLIFSASGKPIFSRYGNESKLSGTTCVLQAFASFVADQGDEIMHINAGTHRFVFLLRGPIYLVAISSTPEPVAYLSRQLQFLYDQILFVLTSGINKVFKTKPEFDLRGLLGGTEGQFSSLIHNANVDPGFLLGSVRCLPLDPQLRADVTAVLHGVHTADLLYSLLVSRHQLVSLVRPKRHPLHSDDLLLVLNLVNSNRSFRFSETWSPMCLPSFNDRGFLYAHVSFLSDDVCLLLVATKDDTFPVLREFKEVIERGLVGLGLFGAVAAAHKTPYTAADLGVPGLRHFLYKARATNQYTTPAHAAPYTRREDQKRLYRAYQQSYYKVHRQVSKPHQLHYSASDSEAILAIVTKEYELYAAFGPMTPKHVMVAAAANIAKWVKREEDKIFINGAPTW